MSSESPFERTTPTPSRWDQEGAEYVRLNEEWVRRCAKRMRELSNFAEELAVLDLAQELSLDDSLRAKAPELVVEDMMRTHIRL